MVKIVCHYCSNWLEDLSIYGGHKVPTTDLPLGLYDGMIYRFSGTCPECGEFEGDIEIGLRRPKE